MEHELMNAIRAANERAWIDRYYEVGSGTPRDNFDAGWDAALDFVAPLLQAWEESNAAGEATDLADETYLLVSLIREDFEALERIAKSARDGGGAGDFPVLGEGL